MSFKTNIAIAGIGYVGLSNAILLSKKNNVVAFDIDKDKVSLVNKRQSPLNEKDIADYLSKENLSLKCTTSAEEAFTDADYVFIATPTDYDPENDYFDTSTVESVIQDVLKFNKNTIIVIRSTIPIGFVDSLREKYSFENIIFCPEFLREGHSIHDSLYPSRIIIGSKDPIARALSKIILSGCPKKNVPVVFTGSHEAEAIKLFANSYLAMRVAFFNELDTYTISKDLDTTQIIKGISLDPRIGDHYNNPSFGYGGYCLPKDSKQLLANFKNIPNRIIRAIVESNTERKKYLAKAIIDKTPNIVGVYRLMMKSGSDNFRSSAVLDIIDILVRNNIEVIIYEPDVSTDQFLNCNVENNITKFKNHCDLIIANRPTKEIADVQSKIFTRDIFGIDE